MLTKTTLGTYILFPSKVPSFRNLFQECSLSLLYPAWRLPVICGFHFLMISFFAQGIGAAPQLNTARTAKCKHSTCSFWKQKYSLTPPFLARVSVIFFKVTQGHIEVCWIALSLITFSRVLMDLHSTSPKHNSNSRIILAGWCIVTTPFE